MAPRLEDAKHKKHALALGEYGICASRFNLTPPVVLRKQIHFVADLAVLHDYEICSLLQQLDVPTSPIAGCCTHYANMLPAFQTFETIVCEDRMLVPDQEMLDISSSNPDLSRLDPTLTRKIVYALDSQDGGSATVESTANALIKVAILVHYQNRGQTYKVQIGGRKKVLSKRALLSFLGTWSWLRGDASPAERASV